MSLTSQLPRNLSGCISALQSLTGKINLSVVQGDYDPELMITNDSKDNINMTLVDYDSSPASFNVILEPGDTYAVIPSYAPGSTLPYYPLIGITH